MKSRVFGIIAVCTFWVPVLYLVTSLGFGITAVVLGRRGRSTAGVVCGWVAIGLSLVNFLLSGLILVT